jgi:hypothetical protein
VAGPPASAAASARGAQTGDTRLHELEAELRSYPGGDDEATAASTDIVLPLQLRHEGRQLSLFSIEAHVGTTNDITVDELTIEAFYPADAETKRSLTRAARADGERGRAHTGC